MTKLTFVALIDQVELEVGEALAGQEGIQKAESCELQHPSVLH
jgi:hypothetical protein